MSTTRMTTLGAATALATLAALAAPAGASSQASHPAPPAESGVSLTNTRVVSIDAQRRLMVIEDNDGGEQTVELADELAGFGDVKAGDEVALVLRKGPGRDRVTYLAKAEAEATETGSAPGADGATTPPATDEETASPPAVRDAAAPLPRDAAAVQAFSARVAGLAGESSLVSRLWTQFRMSCDVSLGHRYEAAPEWVSLWEGTTRMDLTNGTCRDLFNQVVGAGQAVSTGMAAALDQARRAGLRPGEIRAVQRAAGMDWSGWGGTPPARQER